MVQKIIGRSLVRTGACPSEDWKTLRFWVSVSNYRGGMGCAYNMLCQRDIGHLSTAVPLAICVWGTFTIYNYSRTSLAQTLWDHENMFETGVVRASEC